MVTVALLMDEVILNQQFSLLLENNAESKQWLAITNLYGRTEIGTRLELKHPNVIYRWTLLKYLLGSVLTPWVFPLWQFGIIVTGIIDRHQGSTN